jgi:glycosyltransferase involved in cell wall biosynthesis
LIADRTAHVPGAPPEAAIAPGGRVPAEPAGATLDVSVIVPISTSDGAVGEVVAALGGELERLGRSWEVIPVFDGVRGPAWDEAVRLARERPDRVRPLAFQQAFGESSCLTEGFRHARGRVVLTTPQYVQVDPHEIAPMLAAIEGGADFVTPWRHPRVDPMLNRVQSAAFNGIMRLILKQRFHDLNCYFRAIRRDVLEELVIYGDQYRFLPVLAARAGFRVVELRVRHLKEWGGTGFFGVGVYVRRFLDILGVFFLAKFTLKPLRFFGALGGLFLLVGGTIAAFLVLQDLFVGGGVYGRQMFLVAVMLITLGVQIIGFGLVGEIIIYTQAKNLREYRIERIDESGRAPDAPPVEVGADGADGDGGRAERAEGAP